MPYLDFLIIVQLLTTLIIKIASSIIDSLKHLDVTNLQMTTDVFTLDWLIFINVIKLMKINPIRLDKNKTTFKTIS